MMKDDMVTLSKAKTLQYKDYCGVLYDSADNYIGEIYKAGDNQFIIINHSNEYQSQLAVTQLPGTFKQNDFVKLEMLDYNLECTCTFIKRFRLKSTGEKNTDVKT